MSDQRDPSGESWDPWAPPSPPHGEPQTQPGAQAQPGAEGPGGGPHPGLPGAAQGQPPAGQGAGSHPGYRQDHTQPLDVSHTQSLHGEPPPQPEWTYDPQPPAHPGHEYQAWGAPAGSPAYPAYTGEGQGHDWTQAHHATTQATLNRRGPGWGALVGVAAVSALLAGLLGGVAGGWLGSSDRLDFGHRSASSIPTVGGGATSRPEGSIANIAAKALPSVVTIRVNGADGTGTGSGFVADAKGHIITNNHVVAGAADTGTIKVELSNGTEINATIAGRDTSYDLAVLKTGRSDLQPLTMGSSSSVVVGDQVIAMGAPLGLDSTVTTGIISALNRPVSPGGNGDEQSYINAIQTDAAINPGNSGGPLLDMQGHVIGINSAIARVPGTTDAQSGNIGVGFAIPSDQVRKTAEQLIRTGKAEHPIIGVILDRQYAGGDGVKILEKATEGREPVSPEGPAGKAGLKPGDVIIEFDGKQVTDPDDLVVAIRAKSVGDQVTMKVRRGSREISVRITLQGTTGQ